MAEPTIDEMLESLKYADDQYGVQNYLDIRAILEQQRVREFGEQLAICVRTGIKEIEERLPYASGEPLTIDDMLGWLGQMAADGNDCGAIPAICAILEQHRTAMLEWKRPTELEMIRAFVERVEKRTGNFRQACLDELAAMEAEVKE